MPEAHNALYTAALDVVAMPHRWRFVRTVKYMLAENLLRPIPPNETTSARHDNSAQRGLTTCKSRAMQRVSSGVGLIFQERFQKPEARREVRFLTVLLYWHSLLLLANNNSNAGPLVCTLPSQKV